jgi:acyl-coenzyme A synthetase/AMP-(fatty) acid ligase
VTASGTLFTIPCEAIINEHPDVYRSALVGVTGGEAGLAIPVMVVEPRKDVRVDRKKLLAEVRVLAGDSQLTRGIDYFLVHETFPVDIRHNAKIFREKLGQWAAKQILPQG